MLSVIIFKNDYELLFYEILYNKSFYNVVLCQLKDCVWLRQYRVYIYTDINQQNVYVTDMHTLQTLVT